MPGFELIGDEEFSEIKHLFDHSKILFATALMTQEMIFTK